MRGMPRVVWLLGLASLLNDVSSEAIFPLLPMFLASLGAPITYIGLIEGSADALASMLKVVAGRLSDRGPRRLLVAGGYALPALARAGMAAAFLPCPGAGGAARRSHGQGNSFRAARRADRRLGVPVATRPCVRPQPGDGSFRRCVRRRPGQRAAGAGRPAARRVLGRGGDRAAGADHPVLPPARSLRGRRSQRAGRHHRPAAERCAADLLPYLAVCVLFALGNSSDAFILVRAREVGWGPTALPLLWSFHHLVKSFAAVPGGTLSDRHSRAMVVSFGWAAYALTYVGFGFATRALADRRPDRRLRPVSRPGRGRRTRDHRRPLRPRRAWARLRAVSRPGRLRGVAGQHRHRLDLEQVGRGVGAGRKRRARRAGVGVPDEADVRRAAAALARSVRARAELSAAPRLHAEVSGRLRAAARAARGGCAAARAGRSAASRRPERRPRRP